MAKTVSLPFDLSNITLAFTTADAHADAFNAMCADMIQWHASGVFPSNANIKAALIAAGRKGATAAVYASAILKWARSGELPKSLNACVNSSPKNHQKKGAGRPSGKGAGKTTAPAAANSGAAVDAVNPDATDNARSPIHRWVRQLNELNAGAFILRDAKNHTMSAEDAAALKDAVSKCLALLGKYTA